MKKHRALCLLICMKILTGTAWAEAPTVPFTFTEGTKANATEVNENFSAVSKAVFDNLKAIGSNTAAIATKQTQISGSCAAGTSIRVVKTDGSVTCQTDTNSGGDITEVTAGSGLTGGGFSGAVTLSIPAGGINASHIATGAVGASQIADNSISTTKIVNEPGITYSPAVSPLLDTLPTCSTTTIISSISITAPSSGYVHVSVNGQLCTFTATVFTWIVLDDSPVGANHDGNNFWLDSSASTRSGIIGEFSSYNFQNVYPVSAPGTYTYYLKACKSGASSGYLYSQPMIGTFYSTQY